MTDPDATGHSDDDTLSWDRERDGQMADYADQPLEVSTEDYDPTKDDASIGRPGHEGARERPSPYQLALPKALAKFGLRVKLVDGWADRGSSRFQPRGSVAHWTASAAGPRASLGVVTHGHPTLAGPLCNVYLDREGIAWVVAAGRANHAGLGGWNGLTGNSSVFGTECEGTAGGSYQGTDFTAAQLDAYPRIVAAYHHLTGTPIASHACGHSEWAPARKIDVGAYMPTLRKQAAAIAASPIIEPEDDMPSVNDILMGATTVTYRDDHGKVRTETHPFAYWVGQIYDYQRTITRALQQLGANLDEVETPTRVLFRLAGGDAVYLAKLDRSPAAWSKIPADQVDAVRSNLAQLSRKVVDFTAQAPVTDPHIYGAEVEWDGSI